MTQPATEVREDAFTGGKVVLAGGRAHRPAAALTLRPEGTPAPPAASCPFCLGNEDQTPPEVWADRPDGSPPDRPGWRIRVVPNKYPAFTPATGPPARGWHEVVIHGPAHHASFSELPEETRVRVVAAWRRRLAALRAEEALAASGGAVIVAVNQGRRAGATLEHSHSQVYATTFRPALVDAEVRRLSGPGCAACALRTERSGGPRLVAESSGLLTVCPWASATPLEALIVPTAHLATLGAMDARTPAGDGRTGGRTADGRTDAGGTLEDPAADGRAADRALAGAIADVLARLRGVLGAEPPLNLVLHTAPPGVADFHWHLHVLPRLTIPAGFELGTGVGINVLDPDQAAGQLRTAVASGR